MIAAPPLPFRVASKRQESHDTWTLEIEPEDGPAEPFAPGQFAMLYAHGAGEVPISVSALRGAALTHTIRSVGAVTARLCALEPGQRVGVRGPYGVGWPLDLAEGRDVVIAAGGIGLAPLRPVIHELMANRERFGEVSILYGARSPDELLFAEELAHVEVTVDSAPSGWHGRVGVVTTLVERARFDPANAIAMMCGPEVMMRFTAAALERRGLPPESIWLSLERSMKCGVGHCGHCQLGHLLLCKDGPCARLDAVDELMRVREL